VNVKIFDLFGKTATRHVRHAAAHGTQPDAQAMTTSKKIDAIEYEMSTEFSTGLSVPDALSSASSSLNDLRQNIEEAALLFGSGQSAAAQNLLIATISGGGTHPEEKLAWRMLLELHEAEGDQSAFDQRALAYARRFETSPPPWQHADDIADQSSGAKLPALNFSGKLTASARPVLEQLFKLGCQHRRFCLEFISVSEADLAGCSALLRMLEGWRQQGCEVRIHKGEALAEKIQSLIQTGRQDHDDSGWRLLMEALWLMQSTAAYEAVCIDYSITYEVSPPPPCSILISSHDVNARPADQAFVMPASIQLPTETLLAEITAYARTHERIVLNCLALRRVDFNAVTPLINGLNQLADIKPVELRDTSFLVSVLVQLVGGTGKLPILNRKT
jgi:ABC-type transporter Mla MlaB component